MITKKILKEQLEITPNYTLGCILSQCFTRYFQPPYCNAERMGVIGANQFRKEKLLSQDILDYWLEVKEDGYPHICKYTDLINHITYAKEKSFLITGKEKELVAKAYPKQKDIEVGFIFPKEANYSGEAYKSIVKQAEELGYKVEGEKMYLQVSPEKAGEIFRAISHSLTISYDAGNKDVSSADES